MKSVLITALLLASTAVHAAAIGGYENLDSIGNLIGNTKSFAKGAVKVAYVSTEEPASSPDHLLVFVYGEEMSITCSSVDANVNGGGFGSIAFDKLTTSYDAAKGLLIKLPANVWTGEDGKYKTEIVKIRVNQSGNNPKISIEK